MLEQASDSNARRVLIQALRLSDITGIPEDKLLEAINDRVKRLQSPGRNLRWEEYQQFVQQGVPFGENTEFEIRPTPVPSELAGWVQTIVRATRLREVRALRGFTRVFPPIPGEEDRVARIALTNTNWLPAVENRGEGIFIQLRLDTLHKWEQQGVVQQRNFKLQDQYARTWRERGRTGTPPRRPTARFILVHSLAHALIRQLSLTCGYGSASLRERLYVDTGDWEMSGLLVFTSSPDADGTLGGLARQGDTKNIVEVFEDGLASMTWCSSDPLCIEGVHTMSEPANGAACHACLLASETSCEEFNSFLDRALLVGTPATPELGYFRDYLLEFWR
jgi:hypothetical protein